jgi:beta-N-acetylhexosaminidase
MSEFGRPRTHQKGCLRRRSPSWLLPWILAAFSTCLIITPVSADYTTPPTAVAQTLSDVIAPRPETIKDRRVQARTERQAAKALPKGRSANVLSRTEILTSDPARLERIGRHLMIGFHNYQDVKRLVEARAIAGIFISDHNVRRRRVDVIRAEIDALQSIRQSQGLPPLIVAADQEGGAVSRLSPPLKKQPALAAVAAKFDDLDERRRAVEAYARVQGTELARLGVNLNFSPVIDLRLQPNNRSDGETRLRLRAISADPDLVSDVAGRYCATLAATDVMCTLKHFPGLGRVKVDTHRRAASLPNPLSEFETSDWIPFRRLMDREFTVTMIGHVRVDEIDKEHLASYSEKVIRDLIRRQWGYSGILITDDFSMGAITRSPDGIGGAAVKALQAGIDIVLVSYSEKHLNTVMTALIEADSKGAFDPAAAARSRDRLARHARVMDGDTAVTK